MIPNLVDAFVGETQILKIYAGTNLVWEKQRGVQLGSLAVGTSVFMNFDGTRTEFLVVHQGNPNASIYDTSCDGTWLLIKNVYDAEIRWMGSLRMTTYDESNIHPELSGTIINKFDADIKTAIRQVKIPYVSTIAASPTIATGSNGLSTKLFLLSAAELNCSDSHAPAGEGAALAYFAGGDENKRMAYRQGQTRPVDWWLRTPYCEKEARYVFSISALGDISRTAPTSKFYSRPAMVMPKELLVDEEFNVIA